MNPNRYTNISNKNFLINNKGTIVEVIGCLIGKSIILKKNTEHDLALLMIATRNAQIDSNLWSNSFESFYYTCYIHSRVMMDFHNELEIDKKIKELFNKSESKIFKKGSIQRHHCI